MSWNKNTYVCSEIDTVIRMLKELDEPYTLTYLGDVRAMGLNDDYGPEPKEFYSIRKLEYRDKIILERMERSCDCDMDDTLVSYTYNRGEEPAEWPLEIYTDEEDFIGPDDEGYLK